MSTSPRRALHGIDVWSGTRLSRRVFLQALGLTGVAAAGMAGGALGAARTVAPSHSIAEQTTRGRIDQLAAALQYDTEAIFRFVSEEIRYDPYDGVLRGPLGTLSSRAGNSADQAALLAALLEASFVPFRFAWAAIDESTGRRLAEAAVSDVATTRQDAVDALVGSLPGQPAPDAPLPDADIQALADRAADSSEQVTAWARDELASTLSTLQDALERAGIQLPGDYTPVPANELERHTWVQAARGPDWLDLDPTLPANVVGDSLAADPVVADALPDDLYHRIELAVIGESIRGEEPVEETLVRVSARADELAGLPIAFLNATPGGVAALGELIAPLQGVSRYVPTLLIGDEAFAGRTIQFGRSSEEDGFFGEDFFGGGEADGESSAEWIELTVSSPGREPEASRHEVFDRFGPAARASGALDLQRLAPLETVDLGEGRSDEILPAQTMSWLTVSTGLPSREDPVMNQGEEDPGAPAVLAQAHHVLRELTALELGLASGSRAFTDSPNVTAFTSSLRSVSDSDVVMDAGLDIWHRSHGTCPVQGTSPAVTPRIVPGVLAHVAERILHGDGTAASGASTISPPVSVGAVFEAALAEGVGFRTLRSASDTAALGYDADGLARLESSLAEGWIAIAPERPVSIGGRDRAGWWLIDPVDGRAVDELDDGRGAEGIEYAITLTPGQLAAEVLRQTVRRCMLSVIIIATGLLDFMLGSVLVAEGVSSGSIGFGLAGYGLGGGGAAVGAYGGAMAAGCAA